MKRTEFIEKNLDTMLEDIKALVPVVTVLDETSAREGAPFGENIAAGLEIFLHMAETMGMKTVNYDGFAGEITVGQGDIMIGILGHMDVVAAGDGWETPPFEAIIKDDKLYGRGSSDDKGPLVSCLYAMKYIEEMGYLGEKYSIRMIIGCDEEEEMRCIAHYVKHAKRLPDFSFVPDGYFPLVNCEKGLIDFDLYFTCEDYPDAEAKVFTLQGGTGRNIVPGKAECELTFPDSDVENIKVRKLMHHPDLTVKPTQKGYLVSAEGVSTHAMSPEKGENAIGKLIHALKETGIVFSCQDFIEQYDTWIGMDYSGEKLGCGWKDEVSGALTLNIGTIEQKETGMLLKANIRYPVSYSYADIQECLVTKLEEIGFTYIEGLAMDALNIEKDSHLVSSLMDAYREVTGDLENDMFSIGGATYARCLPNSVSFGPLFPYEEELAHEANECIAIESLRKMTEIYITALENLIR